MRVVVLHAYTMSSTRSTTHTDHAAGRHITNMYTQLVIHHSEREHAQRQHYDQAISWADLT